VCKIYNTCMTLPLRVRLQAGQIINNNLFLLREGRAGCFGLRCLSPRCCLADGCTGFNNLLPQMIACFFSFCNNITQTVESRKIAFSMVRVSGQNHFHSLLSTAINYIATFLDYAYIPIVTMNDDCFSYSHSSLD
jgi:hypothetical protein